MVFFRVRGLAFIVHIFHCFSLAPPPVVRSCRHLSCRHPPCLRSQRPGPEFAHDARSSQYVGGARRAGEREESESVRVHA